MSADILYRTLDSSPEIIEGIQSGLYSVWGGVVRVAKGHEGAGKIIGHLRFPGDAEKARQSIDRLQDLLGEAGGVQEALGALQNLQYANLALSGLNLAVSIAGFAIVCKKLNAISDQLNDHSEKLDILIEMAAEARAREDLRDSARFRASLKTIRQFSETGDIQGLKTQVGPLHEQYEITRLTLSRAAIDVTGGHFLDRLGILMSLQERMMYLAFLQSYVQQRMGAHKLALETLRELQADWLVINSAVVDAVTTNQKWIEGLDQDCAGNIISFLQYRKDMTQAIEYQASLLEFTDGNPQALQFLGDETAEIFFLAA